VSKFTVLEKTDSNPYQAQIAALEARLAEEKAAGKGPRHPDVIKVRQNLQEVKALAEGASGNTRSAVRSSKNPIYAAAEARVYELESSLAVARQEKRRLEKQVGGAERKAALMPEQLSELRDLQDGYSAAKKDYDQVVAKLKQSEQQVELERASAEARHDLITPPQLEYVDHRSEMRKRAMKSVIAFAGIGFLAVAGWLVYRRKLTLGMLKLPKKTVPASV
jgi:succinoglycan biosynthesis transport protein ExoP